MGVYEDIIFPGTTIEWTLAYETGIRLDGVSLECAITGETVTTTCSSPTPGALRWEGEDWPYKEATWLVYEMDFYVDATLDCDRPDQATVEGLEFTWQHICLPWSHGFGVQFSKGGEWRYWNDEKDSDGKALGWVSFSPAIDQCIGPGEWHHLVLEGYVTESHIQYHSMVLDDKEFDLSSAKLPLVAATEGWVENFIQIGMQINGNQAVEEGHGEGVDPVTVWVDNVEFKGYKSL
ncbi:MAG: hypothetical protein R2751_15305 [Bacteroidales bacterium]